MQYNGKDTLAMLVVFLVGAFALAWLLILLCMGIYKLDELFGIGTVLLYGSYGIMGLAVVWGVTRFIRRKLWKALGE